MNMSGDKLAIEGGTPVRTNPFPGREPFGPGDEHQLREVLRSQNALLPTSTKVYQFERRFREAYGASYAVASTPLAGSYGTVSSTQSKSLLAQKRVPALTGPWSDCDELYSRRQRRSKRNWFT